MDIKDECEQLNVICQGCLAADRKVRCISGEMSNLFYALRNDNNIQQRLKLILCWECIAFLLKMKMFRMRIQTAQSLLMQYTHFFFKKEGFPKVNRLSSLQKFHINTFNYEFHEADKNKLATLDNINIFKEKDENKDLLDVYLEERKEENAEDLLSDIKLEYNDSVKEEYSYDNDSDYHETLLQIKNEASLQKAFKKKQYKRNNIEAIVTKRKDFSLKTYMNFAEPISLEHSEYEKVMQQTERRMGYPRMAFKCVECRQGFSKKLDLQRHDSSFHSDKLNFPFKCAACSQTLSSIEELTHHLTVTHVRTYHRCKICSDVYLSHEIKGHMKHKHRHNYKCKDCGVDCCSVSEFRRHYKKEHPKAVCDHCNMQFMKKNTLISHIKMMHTPGYCNICAREFRNQRALRTHNTENHPELTDGETRKELSYCVECNRQYPSVYKYRRHLLESPRHTPQAKVRVPCPECGKVFSRTNFMKNHYKFAHLKVTKNYCQQCDKYYTTGYGLRKHIEKIHKKIAPVKDKFCDICGRGFSNTTILKNHRRTHTGERPFKCRHCPAAFTQQFARTSHEKTQHKNLQ